MKILHWIWDNILFVSTLFLLAFIPLYPKFPLVDVKNTWVYVRAEDFVVVLVLFLWVLLLVRKKVALKTPLTMPILLFWIVGALATIHGVLIIFPFLADVFPNVSLLSFLRRIEYLSVYFIAFSGMRDKRYVQYVIITLVITLLLVVGYGIGQRYLGFPAFLTMNEEFAKGEPIHLSQLSRIPSTFAGHYDLAAYLVLIIPIFVSLAFGVKNWFGKGFLLFTAGAGFVLLFMTVSRVSFFVLFIGLGLVLLFQKKKLFLFSIPVIAILTFFLLSFTPALRDRFFNTVKEVDLLVNANTGEVLGQARYVDPKYFKGKQIVQDFYLNYQSLGQPAVNFLGKAATVSGIVDWSVIRRKVVLLGEQRVSTGEDLPQGTGYINLSLSPVTHKTGDYFYEPKHKIASQSGGVSADVVIVHGSYLIKRAAAYDLSFTTRFQGEWPHAIAAFMRNILFGSGYGSISLAIDNNYFRILGEVGLLGAITFFSIFLATGIYIRKTLPQIDSPMVKSFVLGYVGGVLGLALNAALIDVFEASKVAFVLWLLTGVVVGILHFYQERKIDIYKELKRAAISPYAIIIYLFIMAFVVYSPMLNNFFVGDDFTWFRWVSQCEKTVTGTFHCPSELSRVIQDFTKSDGFFYRPGTKVYFLLMYSLFWMNQVVYHFASILLHFIVAVLVFLLARKVFKNLLFAAIGAFLFLVLSGYSEAIFWVSSTGYLFTSLFALLGLLLFTTWEEKKQVGYYIAILFCITFGLFFHEFGVIVPLLLITYKWIHDERIELQILKNLSYLGLFIPVFIYWIMRYMANSHWFSGDYSYNLVKLPVNIVGNALGYLMLSLMGPMGMPLYESLRNHTKNSLVLVVITPVLIICITIILYIVRQKLVKLFTKLKKTDRQAITFSIVFFVLGLLPFLGLGNITSRYIYFSSIGVVFLFVLLVKFLYWYLQTQGREIAMAIVILLISSFLLLHLIQIEEIQGEWKAAGEKVQQFLAGVDASYEDYWATDSMKFYFVNVPIRIGEAWVFPVGLTDALWFSSRNPDIHVYKEPSVDVALKKVTTNKDEKVFEFMDNGSIVPHLKKPIIP